MGKFLQGLAEELTLYVRQLAWLHAVPKVPLEKPGIAEPKSRLRALQDEGQEPELPPVSAGIEIAGWLMEAGPSSHGEALSWQELQSWQLQSGVTLEPWQGRLMRALSGAYLAELSLAEEPLRPAPLMSINADRREQVARHIKNILRG